MENKFGNLSKKDLQSTTGGSVILGPVVIGVLGTLLMKKLKK